MLKLDELSVDNYSEHIINSDLFHNKPKWMESGSHHISTALFRNEHFVAVDGMQRDKYINTLLLAFFKIFEWFNDWKLQNVKIRCK